MALDDRGALLARRRVPTPRHDYAATLAAIAGLVRELEAETGGRGTVGVGMPGATSPATGLVKNANSTWLNGRALDHDLSSLRGRPLRFANDANCFALSEAADGAGAGQRVVFGAILGTGAGSAHACAAARARLDRARAPRSWCRRGRCRCAGPAGPFRP